MPNIADNAIADEAHEVLRLDFFDCASEVACVIPREMDEPSVTSEPEETGGTEESYEQDAAYGF